MSAPVHEHVWTKDDSMSDFVIHRFRCRDCNVIGWRTALVTRNSRRKEVRAYVSGHAPSYVTAEPVTAKPRSAGNNATGGYLPPGASTGSRR